MGRASSRTPARTLTRARARSAARVVDLHTAEFVGTLEVGAAPAALGGVLSVQGLQCAALPVVDGGGTVVCRASMNGASVSTEGTPGTAEPSWEQALRLAVTRESVTQGGAGAMLDLELVETEGGEVRPEQNPRPALCGAHS